MTQSREAQIAELQAAGRRWQGRAPARAQTREQLRLGGPAAAESAERVRANIAWRENTRPLQLVERILGPSIDFRPYAPTPEAGLAARPVARIVTIPLAGFEPQGFGTGFLVAPGVLLTNNHVFERFEDTIGNAANFGYESTPQGIARGSSVAFTQDPDGFVTDAALDFTLVALEHDPGQGFHPLYGATGKILLGQRINIIQHPGGGPRQYAVEQNELVDLLPDFIHYTTDTLPGSSGSPNFNSHWEVVGLHHQGVPKMQGDMILAKNGEPWNSQTMTDADIDWVANEGVRVSRIVERLVERRTENPRLAPLVDRVLRVHEAVVAGRASVAAPASPMLGLQSLQGAAMSSTTIHIHAPTTIYTGPVGATTTPGPTPIVPSPAPDAGRDAFEKISIDPNYGARAGYQTDFLGAGGDVPLPIIPAAMAADIAALKNGDRTGVLKYHHFSIVMHATRKLAVFTAVNIDGKKGKRPARETDQWFFDPRMDRKHQIGEDLYKANPLDRGHLVRRLDPAWGTVKVAKVANDDTFHFTNCSPQHANLNQKIWADLEDHLLDHAGEDRVRLTVFTGAVFKHDDPVYRGVALPRRFWKVAVMRDTAGDLLAAGFVQSQRTMIAGLKESDFLRQDMRTDQFKVAQIEALTGLLFSIPPEADALHGEPDVVIPEALGLRGRRLDRLEDIKLR